MTAAPILAWRQTVRRTRTFTRLASAGAHGAPGRWAPWPVLGRRWGGGADRGEPELPHAARGPSGTGRSLARPSLPPDAHAPVLLRTSEPGVLFRPPGSWPRALPSAFSSSGNLAFQIVDTSTSASFLQRRLGLPLLHTVSSFLPLADSSGTVTGTPCSLA